MAAVDIFEWCVSNYQKPVKGREDWFIRDQWPEMRMAWKVATEGPKDKPYVSMFDGLEKRKPMEDETDGNI